jgi:hypothetical protein
MTDIWQQPPADRPVQYVKFGPAPHQEIRAEVAAAILTGWHAKDPKRFGDALRDAMISSNGHTP